MSAPLGSRRSPERRRASARERFDRASAALLIVSLSPVLALRAGVARWRHGRCLERDERAPASGTHGSLSRFAGLERGRDLALLFDVAAGRLAWVGPAPGTAAPEPGVRAVRPGLLCRRRVRRLSGTDHDADEATDALDDYTLVESLSVLLRFCVARILAPAAGARRLDTFDILGVAIDNHTVASALALIDERATRRERTALAFVNPDCLNKAVGDADYRGSLESMDAVFADGSGLQLAARALGLRIDANVNGTDLFPLLCARSARAGHSLYLLGARPGIAAEVADNMRERFAGLRVVGTRDGYFAPSDEAAVIDEINASGADIVLVAFGAPRQERWIERHRDALDASVLVGVGGLFDFYAGRVSRAPRWLRDIGMEWTWRLLQEPGRMWRRYLVGNPLFVWRVWRQRRRERSTQATGGIAGRGFAAWRARLHHRLAHFAWFARAATARVARRSLDIGVAALALLALSPLLLGVAAAVRLESPGPVLFSQRRVGKWGRPFRMLKFRSMRTDAEAHRAALDAANEMESGVLFKMRADPRVTRTGRFIRRYSIDEMPQLWNVLTGDMALVGPRPALPDEVAQYSVEDRRRLGIKPGITCLWQVSGRSEIPFPEQVALDVDYIETHGVRRDLGILLRTVPAVLGGRGAY